MQSDFAQKYWDLANAIVAFSVLQMLTFLYSLANKNFRAQIAKAFWPVLVAIAGSAILYIVGVIACYQAESELRGLASATQTAAANGVSNHTMWARVGIVAFYSLSGSVLLCVAKRSGWGLKRPS
jgi:phosphoglycerol transferase MdoB-like AlkP superfamily enzyme